MKITFRVDASTTIGSGHVIRDLTLAERLRALGSEILFVCRDHAGALTDLIAQRQFDVTTLARPALAPATDETYADWLGVTPEQDAQETKKALAAKGFAPCDWMVVDHYGLDRRWERPMRSVARRICVIDDLADRPHDCDLLLDQNLVGGLDERYRALVPKSAQQLLGPQYVLLQPEFAAIAARSSVRSGRTVLAYFGASDLPDLTSMTIEAFSGIAVTDVSLVAVVGHSNPHKDRVAALAARDQRVSLRQPMPSLAGLLAEVDLCVGAGGATTWERLCLDVPSIVYAVAENQVPVSRYLDSLGAILYLGEVGSADVRTLRLAMERALSGEWRPQRPAETSVDGLGADRVAQVMLQHQSTAPELRYATLDDEALLLAWANEAQSRRNALNPALISPEVHAKWLRKRLANAETCLILVAELNTRPLGQVRFEQDEIGRWVVSYAVDAEYRGQGYGTKMLAAALAALRQREDGAVVIARVKPHNLASLALLTKLGFEIETSNEHCVELHNAQFGRAGF